MTLNRILGGGGAVFGLVLLLFVIPAHTSTVSYGALAPAGFPSFAAVLLVVFGLVQAVRPTGTAELDLAELVRAAAALGLAALAVWAMPQAGYLVVGPLLVAATMLFMGERRWLWLAGGVVAAPALIWMLFELVLGRPLP